MTLTDEGTTPTLVPEPADATRQERSLGELVASATANLSTLVRTEVELAKVEIKKEVVAVGIGAGAFGAAGIVGLLALLFLSTGAAFGIAVWINVWAGFLIVGGVYLVIGFIAFLVGRKSLKKVGPPTHTIATVKGDVAWAKHPTQQPAKAPSAS